MGEAYAQRLAQANPKEYRILEMPKVEVTQLPPVEPQKKSVIVAEVEPAKETTEEEKPKRGRPSKS